MSFNIVDLVKDQISDQVLGSIGNSLGLQGPQAGNALSGALPGLLSGLTKSTGTAAGAGALFDAVQRQDDGFLGNMGNLLGGNQATAIAGQGSSLLTSLLGDGALGKLAGVVASMAGISRGNSGSLLGMLAPIVLSVIKKKVFDGGLNANSLAGLLSDQQSNINAAMPSGFADQLQSQGFFDSIGAPSVADAVPSPAPAATSVGHEPVAAHPQGSSSGGGFLKWLLPLAAVAALAWFGMKYFGGNDLQDTAGSAVSSISDEAMQAARDAMPAGMDLDNITNGFEGVFSSTKETFEGITNVESATAALPDLTDAADKLGGLGDVVARLPDAAKGPVASIVGNGVATLQPLIEKVMAIPGVGDVIGPVVNPMLEMLQGLAG